MIATMLMVTLALAQPLRIWSGRDASLADR
jgi:hypothetical protein